MATVATSIMQPDEDAIKAHLELLFAPLRDVYAGGLIEICHGPSKPDRAAYFTIHKDGVADATAFAAARARAGENVYVGVNPRKPRADSTQRANDEDVGIAIWQFADIDKEESLLGLGKKLRALPPYFTADTGTVPHRRPHLYWLLDEPVRNLAAWTERQRGLAQVLGGDSVINPSRIMRLAGTVNFPPQHKVQRGYRVEVVKLKTEFDDEREPVTPEEVATAYPVSARNEAFDPQTGEVLPAGQTTLSAMARGNGVRPSDYIGAILSGDSWHNHYRDLVAHWIGVGWTDAEILLTAPGLTLSGYTVADTERAVRQYIKSAREKFGVPEPQDRSVEETKRIEEAASTFSATQFVWRAENAIPPRKWLYGRHLLRKFLSVDIAGGGVGKSSVKIGEALAMTSNRSLYGQDVYEGPLRVWLYNLEDPAEETERRIHATAKRFAIAPDDIADRLFVDSGRDQPCVLAEDTKDGAKIIVPIVDAIIAQIKERNIDVLVIDPFVSSHNVSENDNGAIDKVSKQWAKIADICNCSINLVHHVRKQNGTEANVDSARGAKSLTDAARSVRVYNKMSKEEAESAGITPEEAAFIFRVQNDKANLSPPEKAEWYRMNNTDLANGDQVGVACPWAWPDPFDGVSITHLRAVQTLIGQGDYREDVRAKAWAGNAIAEVLNLNIDEKSDRKRATQILKEWIKNGSLEVVETEDKHRKIRKQVIVGKWAE
ncbi:hypothetical protein MTsN3n11_14050 [Qipengyuania sp. MTN3-11]